MATAIKGRPRKYAEYEELLAGPPKTIAKRPRYLKSIGVFRGARGNTAWIKIRLRKATAYKGKFYAAGSSLEIKVGNLASWTWQQLEQRHIELQGKADRGEPLEDAQQILFKDFAKSWLKRAKVRLKAYETDEIHVRCHLQPFFGDKALASISTGDVNNWIARRLASAAPASVKRGLGTLSSIMTDARRSGHVEINPCGDADTIRGIVGRQRFMSLEEIVTLLDAAKQAADWLPDLIIWGIHSGMRKSEILNLEWSNIQALADGRTIASVTTSKADRPRMVPCTKSMNEVLERQKVRKREGNAAVFPITKMTLRRKWEEARRAANLLDVTMHDLRRTHSTQAAAAGVDLRTLAGRIGHTDLTMLEKHYAMIVGTAAQEAAETIQAVFGEATSCPSSSSW